jgi:hypothetical protein
VEDDNGWQEAGHGGGGRGATVVQWQRFHGTVMEAGPLPLPLPFLLPLLLPLPLPLPLPFIIFSFLGGVESYLQSYPLQYYQK